MLKLFLFMWNNICTREITFVACKTTFGKQTHTVSWINSAFHLCLRTGLKSILLLWLHFMAALSFLCMSLFRKVIGESTGDSSLQMIFPGNSCSSNPDSCLKREQLPSSCGNETLQQCSRELPAASLGVTSFPHFVIALHHQPFSYHLISFVEFLYCEFLWITTEF